MKNLIAALLITTSMVATAATAPTTADSITSVDVSNLTASQKAELIKQIAEIETSKKGSSTTVSTISETARTEVSKWSELGTGMGKAAVAAAKEIGVAANEFVSTPLGKITMGIVIYKVMGRDVVKVVTGSFIMVFFFSVGIYFVLTKHGITRYENRPLLSGTKANGDTWSFLNRSKLVSYQPDGDTVIWHMIAAAICAGVGLVGGLNVMF